MSITCLHETSFTEHDQQNLILAAKGGMWWARLSLLVVLAAHAAAMDDLVFGEDPRKPVEVDATLMCHACHAAVSETVKHVRACSCRRQHTL